MKKLLVIISLTISANCFTADKSSFRKIDLRWDRMKARQLSAQRKTTPPTKSPEIKIIEIFQSHLIAAARELNKEQIQIELFIQIYDTIALSLARLAPGYNPLYYYRNLVRVTYPKSYKYISDDPIYNLLQEHVSKN